MTLLGGIEGGGTKFVCAVGHGPGAGLLARASFKTEVGPAALFEAVVAWFREQQRLHGELAAIGLASFGPVDLDVSSPSYGHITTTPKPNWANADVVGPLKRAFAGVPVGFDTDVNGAALGEHAWGAARGLDDFVYVTIGTGIGAGGMARGRLLHGLVHPEMGHIRLPRFAGDTFAGICPFHGDCWEGLCSGPALEARAGIPAKDLPRDHEAWRYQARYVASAIATLVCVLSPRRVIIGGSVPKAGGNSFDADNAFFRTVREELRASLNGYVQHAALTTDAGLREYVVPPALGDDAGVCGAFALARSALDRGLKCA
jgi:fructokinase